MCARSFFIVYTGALPAHLPRNDTTPDESSCDDAKMTISTIKIYDIMLLRMRTPMPAYCHYIFQILVIDPRRINQ